MRRTVTTWAQVFWRHATPINLERAGFVRCSHEDGCKTFVDPVNVPALRCHEHQSKR